MSSAVANLPANLEPAFIIPSSLLGFHGEAKGLRSPDVGGTEARKTTSLQSPRESRSTSAGSSPVASPLEGSPSPVNSPSRCETPKLRQQIALMGLPEDVYKMPQNLMTPPRPKLQAAPLVTPVRKKLSLDECIEEPTHTMSPFGVIRAPPGLSDADTVASQPHRTAASPKKKTQVLCLASALEEEQPPSSNQSLAPLLQIEAAANLFSALSPMLSQDPVVLPASSVQQQHLSGSCKPCAFFHRRGCSNGLQCTFCHICGPNEKQKRKQDKAAKQLHA